MSRRLEFTKVFKIAEDKFPFGKHFAIKIEY